VRVREYNNVVVRREWRERMAERKERKAVGRDRGVTYSGNIKEETLEVVQQPEKSVREKLQSKKYFNDTVCGSAQTIYPCCSYFQQTLWNSLHAASQT